ncbi:MAG: glycosyltransferase [Candidatus Omnitrophica bacterium]|nr:glycosyltransferase [Candidatus Omnitrophota bacterium]
MRVERRCVDHPVFSICIPQYNRTRFLIEACKSFQSQTFRSFEVCISDDCSNDGLEETLLEFLKSSGMSFIYTRQERNKRYDGNLRAAVALAGGTYCFLMGNDDCLASPSVLQRLHDEVARHKLPDVVITNYEDFSTGRQFRRVRQTALVGSGPETACRSFRNFSFVSGVLLRSDKAQMCATDQWDGSEMYQTYVGSRMIAQGGTLLEIDQITVRQGIAIPGERVGSYQTKPRLSPCPIEERKIPLVDFGRLVADAIRPYHEGTARRRREEKIFFQILMFTYPYWILEYRRVQSWRYSVGICLGLRPRNMLKNADLSAAGRLRLGCLYGVVTLCGLIIPLKIFQALEKVLYRVAKAFR